MSSLDSELWTICRREPRSEPDGGSKVCMYSAWFTSDRQCSDERATHSRALHYSHNLPCCSRVVTVIYRTQAAMQTRSLQELFFFFFAVISKSLLSCCKSSLHISPVSVSNQKRRMLSDYLHVTCGCLWSDSNWQIITSNSRIPRNGTFQGIGIHSIL